MANPQDFLLNTDYELDKVVLFKQGEFTGSIEIPHTLGFIPLPFGVWSVDEDFSSTNPIGPTTPQFNPTITDYPMGVWFSSYNNRIKLTANGKDSQTTKCYYRLYAFEPSDSKNKAPHTSNKANQFILNTDYNYCKLKKDGVFTQNNQKFEHNLGYIPQVMCWAEYTLFGEPEIQLVTGARFGTNTIAPKLTVTDKHIQIQDMDTQLVNKCYWRVYYDKA